MPLPTMNRYFYAVTTDKSSPVHGGRWCRSMTRNRGQDNLKMAGKPNIRERACKGLSLLYVFILIIYGISLPLAPMVSKDVISRLIPIVYFCVLYLLSIWFLMYVHCYLLKDIGKTNLKPKKRVSYPMSVYSVTKDYDKKYNTESDDVNHDNLDKNITREEDDESESTPEPDEKQLDMYEHVFQGPRTIPMVTTFCHGEGSYPNFYLRVGAVVFGCGIMLYCGLAVAQGAHDITCGSANDVTYGLIAVQTLLFIFTFYQLYFIFRHNKISINVHKPLARFGLMHLVATNACNWFLILLREAEHGFNHIDDASHGGSHTTAAPTSQSNVTDPCATNVMISINNSLQPYLFPCIIEYSIIMAASVYQICENIGLHERLLLKRAVGGARHQEETSSAEHIPVTCHKSYHGLFTGIAFLILTIIGIVLYNVLYFRDHLQEGAAILYFCLEFVMILILLVAVIIAWRMIQKLAWDENTLEGLDAVLLIVSLLGVYLFDSFCILYAAYHNVVYAIVMGILRPVLSSVQATIQVLFIFDGGHRFTNSIDICKRKPGRELVIFSLMLNMALWALYTFQARTMFSDPSYFTLYDRPAWVVITHLTIPLGIFFRFHSTTCFYEIWKHAYAKKKQH